ANVEQTVAGVDGQALSVKYKGGEKKIVVTPETSVVTYVAGDRSDLKAGTKIFVAATKQPDGTLQTAPVTYGKDGLTPPMWRDAGDPQQKQSRARWACAQAAAIVRFSVQPFGGNQVD